MVQAQSSSNIRTSPEKKERQNLIKNFWKRLSSPKTNYTYSISPSYSCESINNLSSFDEEDYSIPIMSRQNLKQRLSELKEMEKSNKNISSQSRFENEEDLFNQSLPRYRHGSRRVYREEHNIVTRSSILSKPRYKTHENQLANSSENQLIARNIPNLYDLSEEEDNINPGIHDNQRSHQNYLFKLLYNTLFIIKYAITYFLHKIYSVSNAMTQLLYHFAHQTKSFTCGHLRHLSLPHHLATRSGDRSHSQPSQSIEGSGDYESEGEYGENRVDNRRSGLRRSTRNIHKDGSEVTRTVANPSEQQYPRTGRHRHPRGQRGATNQSHESGAIGGVGSRIYSAASCIKDGASHLISRGGNFVKGTFIDPCSRAMRSRGIEGESGRDYGSRRDLDSDVSRRDHLHLHHRTDRDVRYGRRRHSLFTLCSLPCLLLLLLPLLAGLLWKRERVDDYLVKNKMTKDYYNPLRTGIHTINEKIGAKIPHVGDIVNSSYHDLMAYVSNLTKSSPGWDTDVRMVPDHSGDKNLKEGSEGSTSSQPVVNALKSAYQSLVKDFDGLKQRLSHLELGGTRGGGREPDPDWWKGKEQRLAGDVTVLLEEKMGREMGELKAKLAGLDQKLAAKVGGSSPVGAGFGGLEAEIKAMTALLDGLQRKYEALTSKTEAQEKDLETAKMALARLTNDKSVQTLIVKTDSLTAQVDVIHKAMEQSRTDTAKLSQFAKDCCKREVAYKEDGSLHDGDVASLLLKLKSSDMDPKMKEKFLGLLQDHFASHSRLDELKSALHIDITKIGKELSDFKNSLVSEIKEKLPFQGSSSASQVGGGTSKGSCIEEQRVRKIIEEMLDTYAADQTGMPDYALESGGGSVVSTRCSETYDAHAALIKLWGIPLWYKSNSPRIAIQPGTQAGQCWAFKGPVGFMVVKLSADIKPTAFSIDHIPKSVSPSGTIDSAPKDFSVWGLRSEHELEGTLLGRYRYDKDGKPLQLFITQQPDAGHFRYIELKIESNWGNPDYTCLYRFRVHGLLNEEHHH